MSQKLKFDDGVFRLHYTYTSFFLLVFVIMVFGKQFIGTRIKCTNVKNSQSQDTVCSVHGTYVVPQAFNKKVGDNQAAGEVPAPGLGEFTNQSQILYISYYNWLIYIIFLQAILFCIPRWLWVAFEGGILETLTMSLRRGVLQESSTIHTINVVANHFISNSKRHNFYARRYFFCLVLCMVNLITQVLLLNMLLNHQFLLYGINFAYYCLYGGHLNPLIRVFPRVTFCDEVDKTTRATVVCAMPLNNIYDKYFLILWYWFCLLFILTLFQILFCVLMYLDPTSRVRLLHSSYGHDDTEHMHAIVQKASYGDFFLMFHIGKNVDFIILRELTRVIIERHSSLENSRQTRPKASTQVLQRNHDKPLQIDSLDESHAHSTGPKAATQSIQTSSP